MQSKHKNKHTHKFHITSRLSFKGTVEIKQIYHGRPTSPIIILLKHKKIF